MFCFHFKTSVAYISKHNSQCKNKVILLRITGVEKHGIKNCLDFNKELIKKC